MTPDVKRFLRALRADHPAAVGYLGDLLRSHAGNVTAVARSLQITPQALRDAARVSLNSRIVFQNGAQGRSRKRRDSAGLWRGKPIGEK